MFRVMRCWVAPGCRTLGEAINNPRLVEEWDRSPTREEAEQRKRHYEEIQASPNLVYWVEEAKG